MGITSTIILFFQGKLIFFTAWNISLLDGKIYEASIEEFILRFSYFIFYFQAFRFLAVGVLSSLNSTLKDFKIYSHKD